MSSLISKPKAKKVVFYFPWEEVSGGPYYLTRLAEELSKNDDYEVYYTDYENGLSDKLLTSGRVKKITVSYHDFSVKINEPITLITPIYWADRVPVIHKDSNILFFNWHICCVPVLKETWGLNTKQLNKFLGLVRDTDSVFFCDYSHWLSQNRPGITFQKKYVPIAVPPKVNIGNTKALIKEEELHITVLGRIVVDKVYSVINLLENLNKLNTSTQFFVNIIGTGPEMVLLDAKNYPNLHIAFQGTVVGQNLEHFLSEKTDVLFAMGTSILEGASLGIPSVVIPHNTAPFYCDRYVYLQNSRDYCLGWTDEQMDELELNETTIKNIVSDIVEKGLKQKLGQEAYAYYLNKHSINTVRAPLEKSILETTLTYEKYCRISSRFYRFYRKYSFLGLPILRIKRSREQNLNGYLFNIIPIFSYRNRKSGAESIVRVFGITLFKIRRSLKS